MDVFESCGEMCVNLCRVYKLIMISRVPGYGHLEYLEVNYWVTNNLGIFGIELEESSQ